MRQLSLCFSALLFSSVALAADYHFGADISGRHL